MRRNLALSVRLLAPLAVLLALAGCRFPLDRTLEPGEVRGRLVFLAAGAGEKSGAEGAQVQVVGTTFSVRADAQGRFVFRKLPVGEHTLAITHSANGTRYGLRLAPVSIAWLDGAHTQKGGVDLGTLTLNALGEITGVVRRQGVPVAGATVVAQGVALARSDAEGRYSLKLPDGTFDLAAVYPDGERMRAASLAQVQVRGSRTVDFELGANDVLSGSVSGTARRIDGSGSGIHLALEPADGAQNRVEQDVTSDDGTFALSSVEVGLYTLVASAEGARTQRLAPVVVTEATSLPPLFLAALSSNDCDGDGQADDLDGDDDEDGVPDTEEPAACVCAPAGSSDADDNGVCDSDEVAPPLAPAPAPGLGSIAPSTVQAGSPAFVLQVRGGGFSPRSVVQVDGVAVPTAYLDSETLEATLSEPFLAAPTTLQITVFTSAPGGGTSEARPLEITPARAGGTIVGVLRGVGGELANDSASDVQMARGGRYVVFTSSASNLVEGDTNGTFDVFLADTCLGAPAGCTPSVERVSVDSAGNELPESSIQPSVSADGRFVAFNTGSAVVPEDTNRKPDVYLRDTCHGAQAGCKPSTRPLSSYLDGHFGSGNTHGSSISADGRYVVFLSFEALSGDFQGLFIRDTCHGAPSGCTERFLQTCVRATGGQPQKSCSDPWLSASGRYLVFQSSSNDLVEGDTNSTINDVDLFVRDTCLGAPSGCTPQTVIITRADDGSPATGLHAAFYKSVSDDGQIAAFMSQARLVAEDTNSDFDIFLRRTCLGQGDGCRPGTELVTLASDGTPSTGSASDAWVSDDGRYVAFSSSGTDLVAGVTMTGGGTFLRDTCRNAGAGCTPHTVLLSNDARGPTKGWHQDPSISADAKVFSFGCDGTEAFDGATFEHTQVCYGTTGL